MDKPSSNDSQSKSEDCTREDFKAVAKAAGLKHGRAEAILAEVLKVVKEWPRYAHASGVSVSQRDKIARTQGSTSTVAGH